MAPPVVGSVPASTILTTWDEDPMDAVMRLRLRMFREAMERIGGAFRRGDEFEATIESFPAHWRIDADESYSFFPLVVRLGSTCVTAEPRADPSRIFSCGADLALDLELARQVRRRGTLKRAAEALARVIDGSATTLTVELAPNYGELRASSTAAAAASSSILVVRTCEVALGDRSGLSLRWDAASAYPAAMSLATHALEFGPTRRVAPDVARVVRLLVDLDVLASSCASGRRESRVACVALDRVHLVLDERDARSALDVILDGRGGARLVQVGAAHAARLGSSPTRPAISLAELAAELRATPVGRE